MADGLACGPALCCHHGRWPRLSILVQGSLHAPAAGNSICSAYTSLDKCVQCSAVIRLQKAAYRCGLDHVCAAVAVQPSGVAGPARAPLGACWWPADGVCSSVPQDSFLWCAVQSWLVFPALPDQLPSAAVPAACLSLQACMCCSTPAEECALASLLPAAMQLSLWEMHWGGTLLLPERCRAAVQVNMCSTTPGQMCMPAWVSSTTQSCRAACPSRLCRVTAFSFAQGPSRLRCGKP